MTMIHLLIGGLMLLGSIVLSPLSHRLGTPVLLVFLIIGMLVGEDGPGGVQFDDFELAFLVGNLALALILLDGGMRTRADTFRVGLRPALTLATLGVVVTAALGGAIAYWIFDLPPMVALLMGAIISSTDAAAVFALLEGRGLRLNERVSATLEIESGSNDPMAIFLTLGLLAWIQTDQMAAPEAVVMFVAQFGAGALLGWLGGLALAHLIGRLPLVPAFYPLLVIGGGIIIFAGTNAVGGSGFLAIYLTGAILANRDVRMMPMILQVQDALAWLAQIVLFLLLGLLATPSQLLPLAGGGFMLALALIFIVRPMATLSTLWIFGFNFREQVFIAWVGLRGAVPIVLALFPVMAELPQALLLFDIAFFVVLVSLLIQGSSLARVARWLKLEVPIASEPLRRVPLDLPAVGQHELMLFPLRGARWQTVRPLSDLSLPAGLAVAAVFRDGELLAPDSKAVVQEGDLVAVFTTPNHLVDLSHALAGEEPPRHLTDRAFFGEFVLDGDVRLGDVEQVYGITVDKLPSELSLSECFARTQHGHPVVGDRLNLDPLTLVVKAVHGDQVTKVGLKLMNNP